MVLLIGLCANHAHDNVHMGTLSNDDRSVCKSCLNNVKYGHQPHLILEIIKETAYCFQHCCSKIAFVDMSTRVCTQLHRDRRHPSPPGSRWQTQTAGGPLSSNERHRWQLKEPQNQGSIYYSRFLAGCL